jgi:hypothetical protein
MVIFQQSILKTTDEKDFVRTNLRKTVEMENFISPSFITAISFMKNLCGHKLKIFSSFQLFKYHDYISAFT